MHTNVYFDPPNIYVSSYWSSINKYIKLVLLMPIFAIKMFLWSELIVIDGVIDKWKTNVMSCVMCIWRTKMCNLLSILYKTHLNIFPFQFAKKEKKSGSYCALRLILGGSLKIATWFYILFLLLRGPAVVGNLSLHLQGSDSVNWICDIQVSW